MTKMNLGERVHKLPIPWILQSSSSFSVRADSACLFFSYCNIVMFFTLLALSQMQSPPVSFPILPRFPTPFIPDTPALLSPTINLFNTDNVFAALATLTFMMYTNHNILTECIFWEFC